MKSHTPHLDTLLRLETQHEDLLRQLDELDKQVVRVLSEYQPKEDQGREMGMMNDEL